MNDADVRGKCAACKYQNNICDENCPLAPFFPSNKVDEFGKVIRLYSIDTLINMLNSVTANEEKAKMAETLILEAKIRYENPVYGSIAVIEKLNLEIEETHKELDLVQKTTAFYKELGKRSSLNKKNEEISTSSTQSLQEYMSNLTLEEAMSITDHPIIQDVKKDHNF
ncbi:LOB domain-containing protein 24-like [Solanum stenotomum]|uniref:LOB domain-containing protein 24-like n=1 Tax=Solanum stenotomum TaxID=172797 RepID=UPI0020D08600|nr:LOB domain-containing protein 24-like [Solanum stenotomum]